MKWSFANSKTHKTENSSCDVLFSFKIADAIDVECDDMTWWIKVKIGFDSAVKVGWSRIEQWFKVKLWFGSNSMK